MLILIDNLSWVELTNSNVNRIEPLELEPLFNPRVPIKSRLASMHSRSKEHILLLSYNLMPSLQVILEWVHPGSVIVSNCWKTYDCLKLKEFMQQAAGHGLTFSHPPSNSGQTTFEGNE